MGLGFQFKVPGKNDVGLGAHLGVLGFLWVWGLGLRGFRV